MIRNHNLRFRPFPCEPGFFLVFFLLFLRYICELGFSIFNYFSIMLVSRVFFYFNYFSIIHVSLVFSILIIFQLYLGAGFFPLF